MAETKVPEATAARVPPGQTITAKWPVYTYGETPRVETRDWRLAITGLVERPITLAWEDLLSFPITRVTSDLHCVTRWSKLGVGFEGARVRDVLDRAGVRAEGTHVMAHAHGGYSTNVPLTELLGDDVLLAYRCEGRPLDAEHGGPCRLLVPQLYLWKSAKWVNGLEVMDQDKPGFWERAGYHMNGDPWKEERHGWAW
jgi:DMSO/TMAO reductase YedYZ molybdopterin-dependent catalytic subunit